jgi:hypothetical protein
VLKHGLYNASLDGHLRQIHNPFFGIQNRHSPDIRFDFFQPPRVTKQVADCIR